MGKHIKLNQSKEKADKAYFDGLTDKVMDRIMEEQSILFQNSKLKELPFLTPEGYFEDLTNSIESKIDKPVKVVSIFPNQWIKYAAAVVLLAISTWAVFNSSFTKEPEDLLANISEEVLIDYVADEEGIMDEILIDEDVMQSVMDNLMADLAYKYEDLIDFENEGFYAENY